MEYDLLQQGRSLDDLGTEALSWRHLEVIVAHVPRTSALGRALGGEQADWGAAEYLLAGVLDALNSGNWQRGGGKGSKPKRVQRPGDKQKGETIGAGAIPIKDFDAWWDQAAETEANTDT
ncbi:hypothetical protein I2485_06845 [Nesterenkonia sp. E16_7]|uniref:hypothetical protein n=1 Tax=unclassified Nesterenkonia TaxID=2629769 RepID=UPI001A935A6B|nr:MULTISPECIES: hypothetical protein [unclassified Nesterenkonia]MBO0596592.1 hypothetical protein [Nesterenkonia sp. E16_10]MBO0598369.1 hypothetical protein [Nesterenkonia sp. E16_7]